MLDKLLCWLWVHSVIDKWFNQTHCVSCFTRTHSIFWMIWPVERADTMCYIIYCVDCGYIRSLNSDLIRHTVLAVSLRFILFFAWSDQWKTRHYVLANLLCWFYLNLVPKKWSNQTQCVICFTNIHSVFCIIWPVKKADTMC